MYATVLCYVLMPIIKHTSTHNYTTWWPASSVNRYSRKIFYHRKKNNLKLNSKAQSDKCNINNNKLYALRPPLDLRPPFSDPGLDSPLLLPPPGGPLRPPLLGPGPWRPPLRLGGAALRQCSQVLGQNLAMIRSSPTWMSMVLSEQAEPSLHLLVLTMVPSVLLTRLQAWCSCGQIEYRVKWMVNMCTTDLC